MYCSKDSKSKRTSKLQDQLKQNVKNLKTSNIGIWGFFPEAIDWNVGAVSLDDKILDEGI